MSVELLEEPERSIAVERLLSALPAIERHGTTDAERFQLIGTFMEGTCLDLQFSLYRHQPRIRPSVLPAHDNTTIDRMADWQRKIRESGVPPAMQALQLERLEAYELYVQSQDRRPPPPPKEDPGCFMDVSEYDD
jgi:hypothetical protein